MAFRLQEPEHSALGTLLKHKIGSPSAAWLLLGTGALSIEDPNELVDGQPLLAWLEKDLDNNWRRLKNYRYPEPARWSGEPLPLAGQSDWPSVPRFAPAAFDVHHRKTPEEASPAESVFACLLAAGADPWVSWKANDSCDGERDGFDVAVSWGSALLVDACLRHRSCPRLSELHARSAWRAASRKERISTEGNRPWVESVETLVQLSSMCGHADALRLLLERGFPLASTAAPRSPLAVAQTEPVCHVLMAYGEKMTARVVQQWESLAQVSLLHASSLDQRRQDLASAIHAAHSGSPGQDFVQRAIRYLKNGELNQVRDCLASAAPDLAAALGDESPTIYRKAMGQALIRFSDLSSGKQSALVQWGLACMGLEITRSPSRLAAIQEGMGVLAAAAQSQAEAPSSDGRLLSPGFSVRGWGQMVWAHLLNKKRSLTSFESLGLTDESRHWERASINMQTVTQTLLTLHPVLPESKRLALREVWEQALSQQLSGRSAHVVTELLESLRPMQSELSSWKLSFNTLAYLYPALQQLSLTERLGWMVVFSHCFHEKDRDVSCVIDPLIKEVKNFPLPWPEDLQDALAEFVSQSRPGPRSSAAWRFMHGTFATLLRAQALDAGLPESSPAAPRGPRF